MHHPMSFARISLIVATPQFTLPRHNQSLVLHCHNHIKVPSFCCTLSPDTFITHCHLSGQWYNSATLMLSEAKLIENKPPRLSVSAVQFSSTRFILQKRKRTIKYSLHSLEICIKLLTKIQNPQKTRKGHLLIHRLQQNVAKRPGFGIRPSKMSTHQ